MQFGRIPSHPQKDASTVTVAVLQVQDATKATSEGKLRSSMSSSIMLNNIVFFVCLLFFLQTSIANNAVKTHVKQVMCSDDRPEWSALAKK